MRSAEHPLCQLRVPAVQPRVGEHTQFTVDHGEHSTVRKRPAAKDLIRHRAERLARLDPVRFVEQHISRDVELRRLTGAQVALRVEPDGERNLDLLEVHQGTTRRSTVIVAPKPEAAISTRLARSTPSRNSTTAPIVTEPRMHDSLIHDGALPRPWGTGVRTLFARTTSLMTTIPKPGRCCASWIARACDRRTRSAFSSSSAMEVSVFTSSPMQHPAACCAGECAPLPWGHAESDVAALGSAVCGSLRNSGRAGRYGQGRIAGVRPVEGRAHWLLRRWRGLHMGGAGR